MANRFIILGNDFLPVNTPAEQKLAARALNKIHPGGVGAEVFVGDRMFADRTSLVLNSVDGQLHHMARRSYDEDSY